MVYKRISDKDKITESDPKMKRFLDPDVSTRKERFWKFSDKVKQVMPDVTPLLRLKSPELCDQCETRLWTRKVRCQKAMYDHMDFVMCETCYPTMVELCNIKGYRLHILQERPLF
jgi:hypothetical protein